MFIRPNMAQGYLPFKLQKDPKGPLEELFFIPLEKMPMPGDLVEIKNGNRAEYYVVSRRYFSQAHEGEWNVGILVRPLTKEKQQTIDSELFGVKKWPETEDEVRAFQEEFGIKCE